MVKVSSKRTSFHPMSIVRRKSVQFLAKKCVLLLLLLASFFLASKWAFHEKIDQWTSGLRASKEALLKRAESQPPQFLSPIIKDHTVAVTGPLPKGAVPSSWLWTPLLSSCTTDTQSTTVKVDPFPPLFDGDLYKKRNRAAIQSKKSETVLDLNHYNQVGRGQGWICSRGQEIRQIINTDIIPILPGAKLEIGPFLNPLLHTTKPDDIIIKYFDVLNLEGLRERAKKIGYPSVREVNIDYVHPTGDLTSIPDKNAFSLVVSSHVIEHQLDFVRHLHAVQNLLLLGGYYVMIVPDKRYCFDHSVPITSIADILEDYYLDRSASGAHKLKSVIEHRALTQHNNAHLHWNNQHDPPFSINILDRMKATMEEFEAYTQRQEYIDVHNYQFTPQSLAHIVDIVFSMQLTSMRVHRVYETVKNQLEFVVVLKKCDVTPSTILNKNGGEVEKIAIQEDYNVPLSWLWHPLEIECFGNNNGDIFPPNFEAALYQKQNQAKFSVSTILDHDHYKQYGRGMGLLASRGQQLKHNFNSEITTKLLGPKLELYPGIEPYMHGDDVKYFDRLSRDAKISLGQTAVHEFDIDFVDANGDLSAVVGKDVFSLILSSHLIGRELDLVHHLNAVSNALVHGGFYVIIVPDKRYCFNQAIPESSLADVIDDHYHNRYLESQHKLKSVLEHRALTQHNDPSAHWSGLHDPPVPSNVVEQLEAAVKEYEAAESSPTNTRIDVHNYIFTPQTLVHIIDTLFRMGVTSLRVHRVYETLINDLEFTVVLQKCNNGKTDSSFQFRNVK